MAGSLGLVSVIVPVYQGEHLIEGAVRSALRQTYQQLEVLVVDDGSTDGTLRVLAGIRDPRLRVERQENGGTASARNRALALARGQYIAFLDADDRWFPQKIEAEVAALEAAGVVGIAYSSYYAVDDRGRLLHLPRLECSAGRLFEKLLAGDDFLMPSLALFDRRVFDAIGGFKADRYHEDYEFILRASRLFPFVPTKRRLVAYRHSQSGKCRNILRDYAKAREEELSLVDDLEASLLPQEAQRLRQTVMRGLYIRFLMYGFNEFARRIEPEVDLRALRGSKKGRLALMFARCGVNVVAPARVTIQWLYRLLGQRGWRAMLRSRDIELRYG